ncbi:hypothetical protein ACFC08_32355 [Streptomyces sp. NPDC056112]|uniref:hypothetical protein n=1 Tax=unclassified Streptomyces TaxID=2593676 RepID=UPI001CD46ED9|nr:hypothetical protein [Streptomyces sp. CoT10]
MLTALYWVTRARWEDWNDVYESVMRVADSVGCPLFLLDALYIADAASPRSSWRSAAAQPALEVLSIGVREGEPLSLELVVDLPHLRTTWLDV